MHAINRPTPTHAVFNAWSTSRALQKQLYSNYSTSITSSLCTHAHPPASQGRWGLAWGSPHDQDIVGYALPAFFATVLEPLQSMIDTGMYNIYVHVYICMSSSYTNNINTALVGHLGTRELAAVGLGNVFYIFLVFNFSTFQVTTTSLVGAATARSDRRAGNAHYAKALWMSLSMGVLLATLMATCSHWLVAGTLLPHCAFSSICPMYQCCSQRQACSGSLYSTFKCAPWVCRPPSFSFQSPAVRIGEIACFHQHSAPHTAARGFKDGRTPLIGALTQYACNLLLDWLLLFVLHCGVPGAAAAAVAAQYLGVAVMLWCQHARGEWDLGDMATRVARQDVAPYAKVRGCVRMSADFANRNTGGRSTAGVQCDVQRHDDGWHGTGGAWGSRRSGRACRCTTSDELLSGMLCMLQCCSTTSGCPVHRQEGAQPSTQAAPVG